MQCKVFGDYRTNRVYLIAMLDLKKKCVLVVFGILLSVGCASDNAEIGQTDEQENESLGIEATWSIPKNEVLGPYFPFPLVTNSSFVGVNEVNYPENHLTTLISLGPNELRAYPNGFVAKYEIINNEFEDKKYALTHCPITSSTICFDRKVDDQTLTLKASGFLYNDNLMPTDIETGSIWSQMLIQGVSGKYDRKTPNTFNAVETDWETVKTYFPEAKVYNEFVEGAEISEGLETEPTNRDFHRYGILSGFIKITVHIFEYDLFHGEGLMVKQAFISGKNVIVVGNKNLNFISSYFVGSNLTFSTDPDNPTNFKDSNGNTYNAMGLVIDGPDKGLQLDSPKAYTAAWAAWQDFFPDLVIHD